MLAVAERKCRAAGAARSLTLVEADTLHLPFADDTFQIVCVAFGLRNVSDTDRGSGDGAGLPARRARGRARILDAALWPLGSLYAWYFHRVLPRIGQCWQAIASRLTIIFRRASASFPQGEALAEGMRAAGLARVELLPVYLRNRNAVRGQKQVIGGP